ncbi:MAG TPA: sigma-70 family RNA polymerase sigma factor [Candidatus Omnitrophota bacterium]|nr:sigma-70 family RNA polymerase sigma factor [Candidatus Omnitrophota bacterium]
MSQTEEIQDDGQLINRCLEKDINAWAKLVLKYSPVISAAIVNRLKLYGFTISEHDIKDIRQQILTELWEKNKLSELKNPRSLPYWIAITSGNAALTYMRQKKNMSDRRFIPISCDYDGQDLADILPSQALNPRSEFSYNELTEKFTEAMEEFSDREKIVFKLHIFHNKRYEDIAGILNIPAGTVASHVKRAKEKLKLSLREFDPDERDRRTHE